MVRAKIKLTPITVVHIGTGEELSPLNFIITEEGILKKFKTEKIISSLTSQKKEELLEKIEKDNLNTIKSFISENILDKDVDYSLEVSQKVRQIYFAKKNDLNNQLLISEMYRSKSSFKPIIPGSSIKGAIRTAIISELGLYIDFYNGENRKNDFEKKVLKFDDPKNDPFRSLKVEDCEIEGENNNFVTDFVNFKEDRRENGDFSQMQIFTEVIKGILLDGDASGEFFMDINEKLLNIDLRQKEKKIIHKFTLTDIMEACNNFYKNQFLEEAENFYEHTKYEYLKRNKDLLQNFIADLKENECVIRVGKFSQIESITVENHRKPWNNKGFGKTRTLTENYFPAGWIKLSFDIKDENQKKLLLFSEENSKKLQKLYEIKSEQLEIGKIYRGKVTTVKSFGAFIELDNGKKGLVHIREIANEYITNIEDYLKRGEIVKVKFISKNEKGYSFSIKQAN